MNLQEVFKALGDGKTISSLPDGDYSISVKDDELLITGHGRIGILQSCQWQIKKPTVTIGGVELVAPEREPLKKGDKYFKIELGGDLPAFIWENNSVDNKWLNQGRIFMTESDAEAMRDALHKLLTGQ